MKVFLCTLTGYAEGRSIEVEALNIREAADKIRQKFKGKHKGFRLVEVRR